MKNKLLVVGLTGTVVTALCCFTPLLPIALGALGLTWLVEMINRDAVLLPVMAGFLVLTGYAVWRLKKRM